MSSKKFIFDPKLTTQQNINKIMEEQRKPTKEYLESLAEQQRQRKLNEPTFYNEFVQGAKDALDVAVPIVTPILKFLIGLGKKNKKNKRKTKK